MSVIGRIANLFRRAKVEREIEEEVAAHLAMRAEDNIASGMSQQQARAMLASALAILSSYASAPLPPMQRCCWKAYGPTCASRRAS
jgi:hypothetical protein